MVKWYFSSIVLSKPHSYCFGQVKNRIKKLAPFFYRSNHVIKQAGFLPVLALIEIGRFFTGFSINKNRSVFYQF